MYNCATRLSTDNSEKKITFLTLKLREMWLLRKKKLGRTWVKKKKTSSLNFTSMKNGQEHYVQLFNDI